MANQVEFEGIADAVTGTLALQATEEGAEALALTVIKGKNDKDKVVYSVACDGVQSAIKTTIKAAVADLLDKMKLHKAAYVIPTNEKEIRFPEKGDNKPKEPETIDELPEEMQSAMREEIVNLNDDFTAYKGAEQNVRQAVRQLATDLREVRSRYNKTQWRIFIAQADAKSDFAAFLTAKNAVSEFVFVGNIPEGLFELIPEGKNSPKAVQAWVNGIRGELVSDIVELVKKHPELSEMGTSEAVRKLLIGHFEGEEDFTIQHDGEAAAKEEMLRLHWENIMEEPNLFSVNSENNLVPRKNAEKQHVTKSLFGSEGADELVSALCRAFNSYVTAAEKAVADDMRDRVKTIAKAGADFKSWSEEEVARHLFNILAARIDESSDEAIDQTTQSANVVLATIQDWINAIADGEMTVADVINPETPDSEEDAEAEADAEA